MQNAIKREIKRIARRALRKKLAAKQKDDKYKIKFNKRTGSTAGQPKAKRKFSKHKHFDPVYCLRNANFLSKVIWYKVKKKEYEPKVAIYYNIPKGDGSSRRIMEFSIPDAALANVMLRRVTARNLKKFSCYSYAYRPDKNILDAIQDLKELDVRERLFVIQIDFEKYFDNIPTKYINKKLNDSRFTITEHEKYVFKKFLNHKYTSIKFYNCKKKHHRRNRGIPQGSSVSLFLANLANHDLDKSLEMAPCRFARFADDTICLSSKYAFAEEVEEIFLRNCIYSGIKINNRKSLGIGMLSEMGKEIRTISYFDFLGYRFSANGMLTMPEKSIKKFKQKVSKMINIYLIQYLKYGFNKSRSSDNPSYDWDLLGLIYELRAFFYGGLSEKEIYDFLENDVKLKRMRGLMGFFCLLDDVQILRDLDGWLVSMVRRAMRERYKILSKKYKSSCPTPSKNELISGDWLDKAAWKGQDFPDVRMPSLVRGWRAARKYYHHYGLGEVDPPRYGDYDGIGDLFDSILEY